MPKVTCGAAEEFLTFPTDTLLALKVDSIEEAEGTKYPQYKWTFKILNIIALGDNSDPTPYEVMVGSKIVTRISARMTTHERNQMRRWVEACLDMTIQEGFELDTDLLIGRNVKGVTKIWTGKEVDTYTGKPRSGHQIDALLPMGSAAAAPLAGGWDQPSPAAAQAWGQQSAWGQQAAPAPAAPVQPQLPQQPPPAAWAAQVPTPQPDPWAGQQPPQSPQVLQPQQPQAPWVGQQYPF